MEISRRYVLGWLLARCESGSDARIAGNGLRKSGPTRRADLAFGQRIGDEGQSGCRPQGASGRWKKLEPTSCQQRQSFFGEPVQDAEILARLSWPIRRIRARVRVLQWLLSLVSHAEPSLGDPLFDPEVVYYGQADEVLAARYARKLAAHQARPERFIGGPPQPTMPAARRQHQPSPEKGGRQRKPTLDFLRPMSQNS